MQRVFLPTPNSQIPPLSNHYGVLISIDFPTSASLMFSGGNRHSVISSVSCDDPPLPVCNFEQLLPPLNSSAELSHQLIYTLNAGSVMLVVM